MLNALVLNKVLDKVTVLAEIEALPDDSIVLAIECVVECCVLIELFMVDRISEPVKTVLVGVVLTVVNGEDAVCN